MESSKICLQADYLTSCLYIYELKNLNVLWSGNSNYNFDVFSDYFRLKHAYELENWDISDYKNLLTTLYTSSDTL